MTNDRIFASFANNQTVVPKHTIFSSVEYKQGELAKRLKELKLSNETGEIAIVLDSMEQIEEVSSEWEMGDINDKFPVIFIIPD